MTNFDEIIPRRNTGSIKYDFATRRGMPEGLLSLWVADMDFRTPPCVIDALVERSRHGIFGYSDSDDAYFETLRAWFARRFGWDVQSDWLVKTPGIVFAINAAVRSLTQEGDAVLIQPPVYYPFARSINANQRRLVINELVYDGSGYTIDFEDFERKIIENDVKLFILCNPHNPVGRVWMRGELMQMGEICLRHNVIVVSDEIHADFVYVGHEHLVFAALKPEFADISVTCTAPSKTFNLAGLQISNIFIPDHELRSRFAAELAQCGAKMVNIMGIVACQAAYSGGEAWLEELKTYLTGNLDFLREFIAARIPDVKLVEPEGTYLVWLDFRALGMDDSALDELIVHRARLWLDAGPMFGEGGSGFQRINIACPRAILQQALEQLEAAVKAL